MLTFQKRNLPTTLQRPFEYTSLVNYYPRVTMPHLHRGDQTAAVVEVCPVECQTRRWRTDIGSSLAAAFSLSLVQTPPPPPRSLPPPVIATRRRDRSRGADSRARAGSAAHFFYRDALSRPPARKWPPVEAGCCDPQWQSSLAPTTRNTRYRARLFATMHVGRQKTNKGRDDIYRCSLPPFLWAGSASPDQRCNGGAAMIIIVYTPIT